jgi:hypothetical protein
MARTMITNARVEALAISLVCRADALDRAAVERAIRAAMRAHGGSRGCAAALAQAYGECPEVTATRVRWAHRAVAAAYGASPESRRLSPAA